MRLENILSKFQKGQISWCSILRSTKILRLVTKLGETTKLHWLRGRRVGWWWLWWHWWIFTAVVDSCFDIWNRPLTSRALVPHTSSSEAGLGSVVRSGESNGKYYKENSTIIFNIFFAKTLSSSRLWVRWPARCLSLRTVKHLRVGNTMRRPDLRIVLFIFDMKTFEKDPTCS